MSWQMIVAGLGLGVIFGALTAVGAFLAVLLLSLMYHTCDFEERRTIRVVKFVAFLIFGIVFAGFGGLFAPFVLGIWAVWGISNDPSSSPAMDNIFYVGYFATIAFYAIFGFLPLAKSRNDSSTNVS